MSDIDHEKMRAIAKTIVAQRADWAFLGAGPDKDASDVARWALDLDKRVREPETERDGYRRLFDDTMGIAGRANAERDAAIARAEKAEAEVGEYATQYDEAHAEIVRLEHEVARLREVLERIDAGDVFLARAALESKP